jgi:2,6-dihydroxypyridine 3-monooxygenase
MGGSLAGLNAAIFLGERGWEVEILERSRRPLEGRGAGIVLHPAVFRALGRDPAEISARATRLRYIDRAGATASEQPCDNRFISYAVLHRELMSRVGPAAYHLGAEVVEFEQSEGEVEVRLADGSQAHADLMVCADGVHSSARRRLLPDVSAEYAGYVGWRGVVAETELTAEAHAIFDGAITYCVVPNSHILVYPIPHPADGSRLINWVWYRNVPEGAQLERLLTDRHGVRHSVSIGAGQAAEENIAELVEGARQTLPPQLVELVGKSAEPFVQVVLDISVPSMAFGRIALIGDAAFALRPHVAAGTAKAAEDAWTLANALAPDACKVPGALRDWERRQLAVARTVTDRSRRAGVRAQFENDWKIGEPLPFGLHEPGDSLMSEISDTTLRSLT